MLENIIKNRLAKSKKKRIKNGLITIKTRNVDNLQFFQAELQRLPKLLNESTLRRIREVSLAIGKSGVHEACKGKKKN